MSIVARRTLDPTSIRDWLPAPKPRVQHPAVAGDERETASRIIAVLLSSRFRKGSVASMRADAFVARHYARVVARVRGAEPVQLTLVAFPFKVPNPLKVGSRALPDLAEVAALRMLEHLDLAVRAVYAPGIEVVIIHDGAYIADAFGVSLDEADAYADYFRSLVRITGADAFVDCVDLIDLLPTQSGNGADPAALPRDPTAFQKTLGMLNVRWVQRESLPRVYEQVREGDPATFTGEAAALHAQVRRSMERYAACDDVLHRFDPRPCVFPEAIHATTKPQPGRLALWLVRRGRSLLPWHGVGVLDEHGRVEVRYAAEVEAGDDYRPVFLEGETSPFFYERV